MATKPRRSLVAVVGVAAAAILFAIVPQFEGTILGKPYVDPVGILTACTGHTGVDVTPGKFYTPEACKALLDNDLVDHAEGVLQCIDVPLTKNQVAAFTSFAFNVGVRAFCKSTLAKLANLGDFVGACAELSKWVMAKGRVLPGLVKRRAAERALCETP